MQGTPRRDRSGADPLTSPMAQTLAMRLSCASGRPSLRSRAAVSRRAGGRAAQRARRSHLLGALLHQSGQTDEAISLIHQAIAIEPRNPDYHYNLGSILQCGGPDAGGDRATQKAIALKSQYAEAHFELGNAYARAEDGECGGELAQRARIASRRTRPRIMNNLGMACASRARRAEAHRALAARRCEAAPDFALAHINIGLGHEHEQGRPRRGDSIARQGARSGAGFIESSQELASAQTGPRPRR